MSRSTGLAIGAAILSITLGVLVGLVIHTGQVQQAERDSSAGAIEATPLPTSASPSTSLYVIPSASGNDSSLPSTGRSAGPPTSGSIPASIPAANVTATTPAPGEGSAATSSSTPVTSLTAAATTGTAGSTADATAGTELPGGDCAALGARSADAHGTTLYCQVDQIERVLRWRAVVRGGGCLNQSMDGMGADGVAYVCRLDDSGLNHWAPAP